MNLALLAYEMRAAGIKSLAIELSDSDQPPVDRERDTLTPGADKPEPEPPKDPTLCIAAGCGEKAEGLFAGRAGREFCRGHALQQAGVRVQP
jgi:hypothetical protein